MIPNFISAIGLHSGGGLTYLYLLHSFLDKEHNTIILDHRVKQKFNFKKARTIYLKKGLMRNVKIFLIRFWHHSKIFKNKKFNESNKIFLREFILNGIPPFFRFNKTNTYVFCQNRLIFENIYFTRKLLNRDFQAYSKTVILLLITKSLFYLFLRHTDSILVQTKTMKHIVESKLDNTVLMQEELWGDFNKDTYKEIININKKSDFRLINYIEEISDQNILLFYPALYGAHKNHINLLKAFFLLSKLKLKPYKLLLTISKNQIMYDKYRNLNDVIFLDRISYIDALHIYKFVDFLLYPSFSESYGLPLVEGKVFNKKIIASDSQYVYDVCKPYLVFDPNSSEDISVKLKTILKKNS